MQPSSKFWDRIANRYSKRPIDNEAAYQKKLQITHEYFNPNLEVLEFGCGTGSTAITHASYVKHIHAIDISSKMIEIAQGKADAKNINNITFEQRAIDEFNVPDKKLDVVLGLSILHLLDNKEEVIAKVYKMLKSGGIFVTSTVCMGGGFNFFKLILPIGRFFGLLPLIKFFTVQELQDCLTDAGFKIDYYWIPSKSKSVFIVGKKSQ